jgi:hypothetical protein
MGRPDFSAPGSGKDDQMLSFFRRRKHPLTKYRLSDNIFEKMLSGIQLCLHGNICNMGEWVKSLDFFL